MKLHGSNVPLRMELDQARNSASTNMPALTELHRAENCASTTMSRLMALNESRPGAHRSYGN
jgi:hypothetical protein